MKCLVCGAEVAEGAAFCTTCGASMAVAHAEMDNPLNNPSEPVSQPVQDTVTPNPTGVPNNEQSVYSNPYTQQPTPQYVPPLVYVDPTDHTSEFTAKDISDNKVIAMTPYLLGIAGIIIALLASKESPYAGFHVRQALKITVVQMLVVIVMAVLCWTIIVPIAGGICSLILVVIRIICFFRVCSGSAKEVPLLNTFGFLK